MVSSPDSSPLRRRSPLAGLDPLALRELCELHPWDLGRLSAAAGLDRSALSHVFAGRRPLPQHAASKFLSRIGVLPTGELDRNHLFVLQARAGNGPLLGSWLERLLPNGADVVQLHRTVDNEGGTGEPRMGWALYDGQTAVLVFGTSGVQLPLTEERWLVLGDLDHADGLLDEANFPDRSEVVQTVAGVPSLEKAILADPRWEHLKRAAAKKGLGVEELLEFVERFQEPSGGKSLFPLFRSKKGQRQDS